MPTCSLESLIVHYYPHYPQQQLLHVHPTETHQDGLLGKVDSLDPLVGHQI